MGHDHSGFVPEGKIRMCKNVCFNWNRFLCLSERYRRTLPELFPETDQLWSGNSGLTFLKTKQNKNPPTWLLSMHSANLSSIFRETQSFKNKNIPQLLCKLRFTSASYLAGGQRFTRNAVQSGCTTLRNRPIRYHKKSLSNYLAILIAAQVPVRQKN